LINNKLNDNTFVKISNPSKNFIANTLWLFASVKGRINFLQLGRFSKFCEQYFRTVLKDRKSNCLLIQSCSRNTFLRSSHHHVFELPLLTIPNRIHLLRCKTIYGEEVSKRSIFIGLTNHC